MQIGFKRFPNFSAHCAKDPSLVPDLARLFWAIQLANRTNPAFASLDDTVSALARVAFLYGLHLSAQKVPASPL